MVVIEVGTRRYTGLYIGRYDSRQRCRHRGRSEGDYKGGPYIVCYDDRQKGCHKSAAYKPGTVLLKVERRADTR